MRYIVLALLFVVVIGFASFLALSQKREPAYSSPDPTSAMVTDSFPTETPTQLVNDSAELISLNIPRSWSVVKDGAQGVRVSGINAESPDFSLRSDDNAQGPFTPTYYESGAQLQISIQGGIQPETDRPVGEIIEEKKVKVDGQEADYFRFKEPSTMQGEILDVRLSKDDKSYFFRFVYNPETLPNGEHLFFTIIDSVAFTD